ncbi:hypothetical protein C343_04843 [Cryptococcus neoformans C23]|uniref:Uncharacterized protein n=1 Tax=Cryptococcus neoformans (strain H99 / ATCC 208821 / CBS 10515 / FGSC 9487) TaxID=235443 RepID=J9VYA9_CRYN9|nr:hypothetical protein CNAG_03490 [Cryptococcus neoformans var. grubii H99]AUB26665.1 hypothetical protein CKF44_03490 [Cryptococcus neoformans var. grubii]OWZ29807.1 hypothetical protein C347_04889 [Cryptococcus neoformans var. grubii AD2-60a]OWZ41681.1 hypothetical protein C343_04843 [Cryptococcus neoformans var. grubii C23]OXC83176.1 hypothetical protein C344_04568 [Cryptococcus neoformans var. grubii AD1-7a]OXG36003.1 hypothetical protein C360_02605 [Cryptococcus neoformans var. grubii Bt|eukprot:XP_012050975.1 hypothetical protein CNAG_03490 [Cryptococcus neoformans var. grubii H99]
MSSNDSFAFRRSRLLALGHPGDTRNTSEILDEHRENRAQAAFEASNNFESSSAGARRPTMISVSSSSSDSIPGVGSATGGPNSRPSAGWRAGSSRAASDGVHHSRRFGPSRRTINDEENEVIYAGGSVRGDDGQAGGSRTGGSRGRNRQRSPRPPNHDIIQLNAALDARARDRQREQPNRRPFFSPSPPPPERAPPSDSQAEPRRIRLGGALFQAGGARRQYLPAVPSQPPQNHLAAEMNPRELLRELFPANMRNMFFVQAALGNQILAGDPGPARREEDLEEILKNVPVPTYDPPMSGFVRSFDMEMAQPNEAIVIDDNGRVVPNKKRRKAQPHLVCAKCESALLVSESYRSPTDRVYALRCGHLIDQRCLHDLITPRTPHELASIDRHPETLDEPPNKRRKSSRKPKKMEKIPDEYKWTCPVEGCGQKHTSKELGGAWMNIEGEGAIAVFA